MLNRISVDSEFFWLVMERSTTINKLRSFDHGPQHWERVWRNGYRLASATGEADLLVVEFFALFHDSMRNNEFDDPQHGKRGASLAWDVGVARHLSEQQWDLLHTACVGHDKGATTTDPTIGVCWDADRLDLPRVGIQPSVEFLSTAAAKAEIEPWVPRTDGSGGVRL